MKAPAHVETARLILRQPAMGDAAAIFDRYASDAEVTRYLGWPRHSSLDDTKAFLRWSAAEWERWPAGPYLIISRADGQLLGGTGLGFEAPHAAVTGYVLAKDSWGRGYATEALAAVVDVAGRIGVSRLSAMCHPEHAPSRRVLEKCGFVQDGQATHRAEFPNLAPGIQQDAFCYVVTLEGQRNG